MANKQTKELSWKVPEYPQYERSKTWYIIAGILGLALLIYTVLNGNFLFAIIIILGVLLSIFSSGKDKELVDFKLDEDGAKINDLFYSWDKFQSYWIVSNEEVTNLGLDLKNWLKTDLYMPIKDYSVEEVEKYVSGFLKRNNDRKEEPFSYFLGRKLKI